MPPAVLKKFISDKEIMKNSDWTDWNNQERCPENSRWVCVDAHIRCDKTGEIAIDKSYLAIGNDEDAPDPWIWEEGNYACNCNRPSFFGHAGGAYDGDGECANEEFSVNLVNPKTGEVFYREFD